MTYNLAFEGAPGAALIGSIEDGRGGGGLFSWDGKAVKQLDADHTMGMTFTGDRLARLLSGVADTGSVGELVVYDKGGVRSYQRIDGAAHPHDLAYDPATDSWLIVASGADQVLWVDQTGRITHTWTAPNRPIGRHGDAWHVNCLTVVDGRVVVSAFGENLDCGERLRRIAEPRGFVTEIETDRPVLTGLVTPHNPTRISGHWVVCGSWEGTVDKYNEGTRVARVTLGGWTRGLAQIGNHLIVGVSGARRSSVGTASLAVIDLQRFVEVDRIPVPVREIYAVLHVPAHVVDWVRIGWDNNPARARQQMRSSILRTPVVYSIARWAQQPGWPQHIVWSVGRRAARSVLPGPSTGRGTIRGAPPMSPGEP